MIKFKLIPFLISFSLCLTFQTKAQSIPDSLQDEYQSCLDKGQNMLACSNFFYHQMDSLLNVYYKKLSSTCDSVQKENLKDEQLEWLTKRDSFFQKTLAEFKKKNPNSSPYGSSSGSKDDAMIMFDQNAEFVTKRVNQLIENTKTDYSPSNYNVKPTGFYNLDSKTETRNGDTYGYFGDIKVRKISPTKVIVRLYVCKGAPSYNSGEASDTLEIKNNVAVYKIEDDASCKIIFTFFKQGIKVDEITDNYNFGCDFGDAVVANGFYKRKSYEVPSDKDFTDE